MKISSLYLNNFRNIKELSINLDDGINVFYGNNAQGKTNILEAMFMCATGRSQRTRSDKDVISFGEESAQIKMGVKNGSLRDNIDINITGGEKKSIYINSLKISRLGELFGKVNIVFFSPEDLLLIKEGPSYRRRYMDMELCQLSGIYYSNLQRYYRVLKERNALLKKIQTNKKLYQTLDVWDEQLSYYGKKIVKDRKDFVASIGEYSKEIMSELTNEREVLKPVYRPSANEDEFSEKLKKGRQKDILYGTTSYGVHKDDIVFYINGINSREYASQGQQRSIILALKLSEIKLIEEKTSYEPVLLLDDVLSELDRQRQLYILESITNVQTMITCTGLDEIRECVGNKCKFFYVKEGNIT